MSWTYRIALLNTQSNQHFQEVTRCHIPPELLHRVIGRGGERIAGRQNRGGEGSFWSRGGRDSSDPKGSGAASASSLPPSWAWKPYTWLLSSVLANYLVQIQVVPIRQAGAQHGIRNTCSLTPKIPPACSNSTLDTAWAQQPHCISVGWDSVEDFFPLHTFFRILSTFLVLV